jgi:hypothetical protein
VNFQGFIVITIGAVLIGMAVNKSYPQVWASLTRPSTSAAKK